MKCKPGHVCGLIIYPKTNFMDFFPTHIMYIFSDFLSPLYIYNGLKVGERLRLGGEQYKHNFITISQ